MNLHVRTPLFYAILILISLTLFSCGKGQLPLEPTPSTVLAPTSGVNVTTSFLGQVIGENDEPIANATIRINNQTTNTDDQGIFSLQNITVDRDWAYIKVEKSGYFHGSRSILPIANTTNKVKIMLLSNTPIADFDATSGGTVTLTTGPVIDFPANSVQDASGNPFTGTVNVAAKYLDPTSSDLDEMMPGNLEGINLEEEYRVLQSFGMIGVEMTDANGSPLQIMDGQEAQITMPVPASLQADAPATIPLWHFDEAVGLWVEEGEATFDGTAYVGTVSHFSYWNCDAPFPLVHLQGQLVDGDGNPFIAGVVCIDFLGDSHCGNSTDSGYFSGKIPANEALGLEVRDICGTVLYNSNIGPFSQSTALPPITINLGNTIEVTGQLENCNGDPVTNGYVFIEYDNIQFPTAVTAGSFSLKIPDCGTNTITLYAVDLDTDLTSYIQTYSATNSTINTGTITACDPILTPYLSIDINGDNIYAEQIYQADNFGFDAYYSSGQDSSSFYLSIPNATSIGSYTPDYISINSDKCNSPSNVNVNLTKYEAVGGYIEGNITGNCTSDTGNNFTLDGNFRLERYF